MTSAFVYAAVRTPFRRFGPCQVGLRTALADFHRATSSLG